MYNLTSVTIGYDVFFQLTNIIGDTTAARRVWWRRTDKPRGPCSSSTTIEWCAARSAVWSGRWVCRGRVAGARGLLRAEIGLRQGLGGSGSASPLSMRAMQRADGRSWLPRGPWSSAGSSAAGSFGSRGISECSGPGRQERQVRAA